MIKRLLQPESTNASLSDINGVTFIPVKPEKSELDDTQDEAKITESYQNTVSANLGAIPTEIRYFRSTGKGSNKPTGEPFAGVPSESGNFVAQMKWGDNSSGNEDAGWTPCQTEGAVAGDDQLAERGSSCRS